MLHHDPEGALGVIINRPTELLLAELLPRWTELLAPPGFVFSGGPVEADGFIGVGRAATVAEVPDEAIAVTGTDLVTVDLQGDPALTGAYIDRLRVFRGYAGWGPRQLDTEMVAGAWFSVDSKPDDMWTTLPDELYADVLKRQRGELRWFANAPLDPTQN